MSQYLIITAKVEYDEKANCFCATVPSMSGVVTQADTLKELEYNIQEAAEMYLQDDDQVSIDEAVRIARARETIYPTGGNGCLKVRITIPGVETAHISTCTPVTKLGDQIPAFVNCGGKLAIRNMSVGHSLLGILITYMTGQIADTFLDRYFANVTFHSVYRVVRGLYLDENNNICLTSNTYEFKTVVSILQLFYANDDAKYTKLHHRYDTINFFHDLNVTVDIKYNENDVIVTDLTVNE